MTLLWQGDWTRWPTEVPSNPRHPVILWTKHVNSHFFKGRAMFQLAHAAGRWMARSAGRLLPICSFSPRACRSCRAALCRSPLRRRGGGCRRTPVQRGGFQQPAGLAPLPHLQGSYIGSQSHQREKDVYTHTPAHNKTHTGRAAELSPGSWLTLNCSAVSRHTTSGSAVTAASRWARPSCQD